MDNVSFEKGTACPKCGKDCGPWKAMLRHVHPGKRGPKKKSEKAAQ